MSTGNVCSVHAIQPDFNPPCLVVRQKLMICSFRVPTPRDDSRFVSVLLCVGFHLSCITFFSMGHNQNCFTHWLLVAQSTGILIASGQLIQQLKESFNVTLLCCTQLVQGSSTQRPAHLQLCHPEVGHSRRAPFINNLRHLSSHSTAADNSQDHAHKHNRKHLHRALEVILSRANSEWFFFLSYAAAGADGLSDGWWNRTETAMTC